MQTGYLPARAIRRTPDRRRNDRGADPFHRNERSDRRARPRVQAGGDDRVTGDDRDEKRDPGRAASCSFPASIDTAAEQDRAGGQRRSRRRRARSKACARQSRACRTCFFYKRLNPQSELSAGLRSLRLSARPNCSRGSAQLRWQILGAGGLLLLGGFIVSQFFPGACRGRSKSWRWSRKKTARNASELKRSCRRPRKSCSARRVFPPMLPTN